MPETTEQVEGGAAKVPKGGWPAVLHVVEIGPGSTPPSFRASAEDDWVSELAKQRYASVPALFSDEVVEAACKKCWPLWGVMRADQKAAGRESLRAALTAAIDHLGGTDAH